MTTDRSTSARSQRKGDRPYANQPFWISHASLPGLPAAVSPIGRTTGGLPAAVSPIGRTTGGLPIGAQIIGPLYEDDTALTFAALLGEVAGGYESPPLDAR
jgi:amidase